MWPNLMKQLKQDLEETDKQIEVLKANMRPYQEAIAKFEGERTRITELMAWAEAQRRDTADVGGKP